jgi:hypothetical protein
MNLYVVGKILDGIGSFSPWYIRGVFDSAEKAFGICVDRNEFVGVLELNKDHGKYGSFEDWQCIYYPITISGGEL